TVLAPSSDPNDPVTFTLVGTLPAGLVLHPDTGIISGVPHLATGLRPGPDVAGGVVTNVVTIFACNSHGCTSNQFIAYLLPTGATNISTRLSVGSGDNVSIAGFILIGNAPLKLLLRGIGPSLSQKGVSGALANPYLELHDITGKLIGENNDWKVNLVDNTSQ